MTLVVLDAPTAEVTAADVVEATDAGDRPEPHEASIGTVVAQQAATTISRRVAEVKG